MRLVIGMLCLAALAGCAQFPQDPPSQQQLGQAVEEVFTQAQAQVPSQAPPRSAGASPAAVAVSTAAHQDPQAFAFEPMSVTLSAADQTRVAALAESAKSAGIITIRGFCDRDAVGNARDAAVARALAVRAVLTKEGVPPSKFRIRYVTEQPRHAAVVEFD